MALSKSTRSPWQQAQAEFECAHSQRSLRVKTLSNGAVQYRRQCLDCGNGGQAVKKDEAAREVRLSEIPPYDETAEQEWFARQRDLAREITAQRAGEEVAARLTELANYYDTPEWAERRDLVLRRDEWKCRAQLPGCVHRARQVHHLSYAHVRCEPLFELVSVCIPCHEQITAMDREARARVFA